MSSSKAVWAAALLCVTGCGSDDAGGGNAGSGGTAASAGIGGSAANAGSGGTGAGAGSGGSGAMAGSAGAGGSGGLAGASGSGGSAGSAGSSSVLFRDDFDGGAGSWSFDATDPVASYEVKNGKLVVSGGSVQAFGWLPIDPAWPDDVEVSMRFRITAGLTGGPVVRGEPVNVDAVNCNVRDDLDQLRAARHQNRNYLTLSSLPSPIQHDVDYTVTARIQGSTLTCIQDGSLTLEQTGIQLPSGAIGFYVYQGTLEIDWFEVRVLSGS